MWKHQGDAVTLAMEIEPLYKTYTCPDLGLFFEQGTGKTRTLIEILRRRFAVAGEVQKTLILCPVIVCENWRKEFAMYSKIAADDVVVLSGHGKKRMQTFLKAVGDTLAGKKIIITNFETMEMGDLHALIKKWGPVNVVADESQRLKNPQSIRARKVVEIADQSASNFILTGTPVLNSPMDLYMQFRILDRGKTFSRNFFAFRNEYFFDENAGFKGKQHYFPKWAPRKESYARLQEVVKRKAVRVLAKDCLDLPPLIRQEETVLMGVAQRKAYQEMADSYVAWLNTQDGPAAVVAQLAITKALRLQQIVSGFAKDENGDIHRFDKCPRMDRLEELLTDLTPENKVIVWAEFKENYKMIAELCTRLQIPYREIHGDISMAQREDQMEEFRKEPHVRVMIANQGAGGVGINLVEASYAIYYSKGFKLEHDLQSMKRNHRGGSEMHEKVIRIDLVCPDSIDELVNEALASKVNISEKILSWKEKLK